MLMTCGIAGVDVRMKESVVKGSTTSCDRQVQEMKRSWKSQISGRKQTSEEERCVCSIGIVLGDSKIMEASGKEKKQRDYSSGH